MAYYVHQYDVPNALLLQIGERITETWSHCLREVALGAFILCSVAYKEYKEYKAQLLCGVPCCV